MCVQRVEQQRVEQQRVEQQRVEQQRVEQQLSADGSPGEGKPRRADGNHLSSERLHHDSGSLVPRPTAAGGPH